MGLKLALLVHVVTGRVNLVDLQTLIFVHCISFFTKVNAKLNLFIKRFRMLHAL